MNLLSQTVRLAEEGGAAPVVAPDTGAGGVFDLLWLVIALPLLGAFLLLAVAPFLQGSLRAAADKHGHLVGTAMSALSFVLSLVLFVALLGLWYARAGRRSDAEAILQELLDGGRCPPVWFAILYGGLGDLDRAMGFLERAIDEHNDQVCFMKVDHRFDELRAHPRFDELLVRTGLRSAP